MIVLELYKRIKGYEEYCDELTGKKSFPKEIGDIGMLESEIKFLE